MCTGSYTAGTHISTYYSHTYNIRYAIRSCLRGVVTIVKFFLIFIIMNRNLFFVIMDCCCCILVANTLPIPTLLLLSTYRRHYVLNMYFYQFILYYIQYQIVNFSITHNNHKLSVLLIYTSIYQVYTTLSTTLLFSFYCKHE